LTFCQNSKLNDSLYLINELNKTRILSPLQFLIFKTYSNCTEFELPTYFSIAAVLVLGLSAQELGIIHQKMHNCHSGQPFSRPSFHCHYNEPVNREEELHSGNVIIYYSVIAFL